MKHAREDYAFIQDVRGVIPKDEPVFLLRGQDPKTQQCMLLWCNLAANDGIDKVMIEQVRKHVKLVDEWQAKIKRKDKSDLPAPSSMKPGQTWESADAKQEVNKGQTWECTDHRENGKQVVVIMVQGVDAICEVVSKNQIRPNSPSTRRQVRIPLAQLLPGPRNRYKLVNEA